MDEERARSGPPDPVATSRDTVAESPLAARKALEGLFTQCRLLRPFHRAAYDPGDRLEYEVTGVVPARAGRVVAEVERFVGGGFAGQVYRIRLLEVACEEGAIAGLEVGRHYAIKILSPASGFARLFRNLLYFLGYQCAFSAQVLPQAVRTGVLWQKMIRRAMAVKSGDGEAVCDTYATFFDREMHSFGEINEWIDGRIWAFEADDRLLSRWRFRGAVPADHNCPEYVHKKLFMRRLVDLLHELGAGELARQYAWGTCKSQPNALKRLGSEGSPSAGLDRRRLPRRPGAARLPAHEPGGLLAHPARSRAGPAGAVRSLRHAPAAAVCRRQRRVRRSRPALEELERQDAAYRASQPDLTRHLFRLFTDRRLRGSIKSATITAWRSLDRLDEEREARLRAAAPRSCRST